MFTVKLCCFPSHSSFYNLNFLLAQSEEYQQSISHFKSVLESSGPAYEQLNDFISYGALPFVPDPRQVPAFKSLFSVCLEPIY